MNYKSYSEPEQLERNSFLWSEVRLVVAAVALFLGGVPPIVYLDLPSGLTSSLLRLGWIISGAASVYLGYRWMKNDWKVFDGKDQKDQAALGVSVISGINLGWVGLAGDNIGMSLASGQLIFLVVGAIYLVAGAHLWRRWKASEECLFY